MALFLPRLPRRFRPPRAELRIDGPRDKLDDRLSLETPPGEFTGGVRLWVALLPLELFRVRRGRLELTLLATRFSRTTLDGYYEYTSERVLETVVLCETQTAHPGRELLYAASLTLPEPPVPPGAGPLRLQWQAKARFAVDGRRELCAVRLLADVSPRQGGAPVVDGAGFLPL